jgi:membrane protein insertase Oxa1/YidC/SpoIIIJ
VAKEYIEKLSSYFYLSTKKDTKKRKKMARIIGKKNLFFTSRCFILFHISQSIIFWSITIIFPLMSYINCASGFLWMSHIAIGTYLVLIFVFDFVFFLQYMEKLNIKTDL